VGVGTRHECIGERNPVRGVIRALRPSDAVGSWPRGYRQLPALRRRSADGIVTTRVAGRRAVVAAGPDAVNAFYDTERFARTDAVTGPLRRTLVGRGAVHELDGAAHRHRKELFLAALAPDRVRALAEQVDHEWAEAVRRWQGVERITVHGEAVGALGRGVLAWAGVPTRPDQLDRRVADLAVLVDGFFSAGPRHVRACLARRRCEGWARTAIRTARSRRSLRARSVGPASPTPLDLVAAHRDAAGALLDERTAAAELLNLLRPTVAVAWLVTFAVVAQAERPDWRERLADGGDAELHAFVDEVRRVYPFVPALAARARYDHDWQGRRLPAGRLFLLDVYGTDTDPAQWKCPHDLDPDRFLSGTADREALVPHGGGDVHTGHRCPGEAATMELTGRAARLFARLSYRLPPQDLRIPLTRVPTVPNSGVVLTHVRRR
jgi:fatty-acid peroxygenase